MTTCSTICGRNEWFEKLETGDGNQKKSSFLVLTPDSRLPSTYL